MQLVDRLPLMEGRALIFQECRFAAPWIVHVFEPVPNLFCSGTKSLLMWKRRPLLQQGVHCGEMLTVKQRSMDLQPSAEQSTVSKKLWLDLRRQ